jgi:hypothetical protein
VCHRDRSYRRARDGGGRERALPRASVPRRRRSKSSTTTVDDVLPASSPRRVALVPARPLRSVARRSGPHLRGRLTSPTTARPHALLCRPPPVRSTARVRPTAPPAMERHRPHRLRSRPRSTWSWRKQCFAPSQARGVAPGDAALVDKDGSPHPPPLLEIW